MRHLVNIPGEPTLIHLASPSLGWRTAGGFAEKQSDVKWVREQMRKENLTCLGSFVAGGGGGKGDDDDDEGGGDGNHGDALFS